MKQPQRYSRALQRVAQTPCKRIIFLTLLIAVAAPFCWGQGEVHITPRVAQSRASNNQHSEEDPSKYQDTQHLRANVDLVLVPVTVTDQRNRLVMGLEQSNFNVYDQQEPQIIRHVSTEDTPLSLGIIFDTSSSMYGKIDASREAVLQFLRSANPEDEFFLILFNDRPEIQTNFTHSVDDIQSDISKAKPDGTTALLDAVYLGLNMMKYAANERKILLIVSDGGENHSGYTPREVFSALME